MLEWLKTFLTERRNYQLLILERKHEHEINMRVCQSCETLKTQIEFQNQLIRELTNPAPIPITTVTEELKPIQPKHIPWSVRRMQLQKADRELAARLRENKEKEITENDLDKELEEMNAKPA